MKKYNYRTAKETIDRICEAAKNGVYDTRDRFMSMLDENPHIAVQGYNAYGKIFFWNPASSHLYGWSEHAAINKELFELILPPDLRAFARDMVLAARRTGKTPEASSCDLLQHNGDLVTVYSGHVIFQWDEGTEPEFYCIDLAINPATA